MSRQRPIHYSSLRPGTPSSPSRCTLVVSVVLLAVFIALGLVGWRLAGGDRHLPDPRDRYLRAVYVLRSLGGPAAFEPEDIPGRVAVADGTESLLHHPDKILVLTHVAEELAEVRQEQPRALLYEAYARLALGEREQAAELLAAHVVEDEYNAAHYRLLATTLYELRDYSSLYIICREWAERDPGCLEQRARLTFAALYNLGRFDQAQAFARKNTDCLGWQADVRAAKAALASGNEPLANQLVQAAVQRHPESGPAVLRLWNLLRDKEEL